MTDESPGRHAGPGSGTAANRLPCSMKRVLVTGASGFIGQHLVERLVTAGYEVRCLLNVHERPGALAGLDLEFLRGDITRPETIAGAFESTDVVYHLAGKTLAFSADEFQRVNAEGTRHVAEACARRLSPPVLVFVSSLAAAGPSPRDQPRDETAPAVPVSNYGRSKQAAEAILGQFSDRLPVTVRRPPGVFGPREVYMYGLFRSIRKGLSISPGLAPVRLSLVDVRDLVEALHLASTRGRRLAPGTGATDGNGNGNNNGDGDGAAEARGIYFIASPETPTFVELSDAIARALERPPAWTVRVPCPLGFALAGLSEAAGRLRGRPFLLILDKMREAVAGSWTCRTDRAHQELGFRPGASLAERLRQTAAWYREHGWL
jgi:dihydroflavonol-4-reductase